MGLRRASRCMRMRPTSCAQVTASLCPRLACFLNKAELLVPVAATAWHLDKRVLHVRS